MDRSSPRVPSEARTDSGQPDRTTGADIKTKRCVPVPALRNLLQGPLLPGDEAGGEIAVDDRWVYLAFGDSLQRVPIAGGPVDSVFRGRVIQGFAIARAETVAWFTGDFDALVLMVNNAAGMRAVVLPSGVTMSLGSLLVDAQGAVFFEVNVPNSAGTHTWRWNPADETAAELPGVGMPGLNAGTNLYFADAGQIIWANNTDDPTQGLYTTDVTTATARRLLGPDVMGFGGIVGLDATNLYGSGSICPRGKCPFTISGVPRAGGSAFVAYQTNESYWTSSVMADESGLYWMDWDAGGSIYHAVLHAGAAAERVVKVSAGLPGSSIPARFAMDACNLYWFTRDPDRTPQVMANAK